MLFLHEVFVDCVGNGGIGGVGVGLRGTNVIGNGSFGKAMHRYLDYWCDGVGKECCCDLDVSGYNVTLAVEEGDYSIRIGVNMLGLELRDRGIGEKEIVKACEEVVDQGFRIEYQDCGEILTRIVFLKPLEVDG